MLPGPTDEDDASSARGKAIREFAIGFGRPTLRSTKTRTRREQNRGITNEVRDSKALFSQRCVQSGLFSIRHNEPESQIVALDTDCGHQLQNESFS
jgi:hypothetical protein